MKKNNLFETIVTQNHILKTILCYLSIKDSYNLSLTNKNNLELTKAIKRRGIIYYWNEYISLCTVDSETEIEISKINPSDDFYSDYPYDLREMEKLKIIILLRKAPISPEVMKAVGKEINNVLEKNLNIQQLSFHFPDPSDAFFAEYLIKELKNDSITHFEISVMYNFWAITANDNIFKNMVNLKKVKIFLQNSFITGIDRKLIDTANLIEDVTIEVAFNNVAINLNNVDVTLQNENCVLSYIISKGIHLSITGTYYKILNLNNFFKKFATNDFSLLRGLCFDVISIDSLREFGEFLPYMINLEWLGIRFDIDNFVQLLYNNTSVNPELYKSFKHLQKLKTIKVMFDSKTSCNEEDGDFESDLDITEGMQNIQKFKEICQKELFYLLKNGPEIVENLYISEMPELTCKMSSTLNNYFPKLNLLFLKKIPKVEIECLTHFKNLGIYISHLMDKINLPESLKICLICNNFELLYGGIQRMFIRDVRSIKNDDKMWDYYRSLNQFKKEYTLDGVLKGKIFFNYFHEYYFVKNYFSDILEMI